MTLFLSEPRHLLLPFDLARIILPAFQRTIEYRNDILHGIVCHFDLGESFVVVVDFKKSEAGNLIGQAGYGANIGGGRPSGVSDVTSIIVKRRKVAVVRGGCRCIAWTTVGFGNF